MHQMRHRQVLPSQLAEAGPLPQMLNKHGIPILSRHPRTKPFDLAAMRPRALQCNGKMRHRSRDNALLHQRAAGPEYKIYNCPWCHYWHIGHSEETLVISFKVPGK